VNTIPRAGLFQSRKRYPLDQFEYTPIVTELQPGQRYHGRVIVEFIEPVHKRPLPDAAMIAYRVEPVDMEADEFLVRVAKALVERLSWRTHPV
jgi:hypothetical protein